MLTVAFMQLILPNKRVSTLFCFRAHLNDLENILPFLLIALFFIGTNPDPVLTQWLFHVFTAARYMHTIAYVFGKSTVFRVLSYFTGLSINIGLGVMSTYAYYKHAHPFV